MVLFGEDELKAGTVKVKDMAVKQEDVVQVAELVPELHRRLAVAAARPPTAVTAAAPPADDASNNANNS